MLGRIERERGLAAGEVGGVDAQRHLERGAPVFADAERELIAVPGGAAVHRAQEAIDHAGVGVAGSGELALVDAVQRTPRVGAALRLPPAVAFRVLDPRGVGGAERPRLAGHTLVEEQTTVSAG